MQQSFMADGESLACRSRQNGNYNKDVQSMQIHTKTHGRRAHNSDSTYRFKYKVTHRQGRMLASALATIRVVHALIIWYT